VARGWLRHLLGACLTAAAVGWPATLASAATSDAPVPGGLSAAAQGSSQISPSWTSPATDGWQPSQYNIYEGTSSGGERLVDSASATNGTRYAATGLASGTTYYFTVIAVYGNCADPDGCVESAQSTEVSATTTAEPVPTAPPTGLTATAAGSSRISLSWTAPAPTAGASVTGYKIYAGTSPGGESPAGSTTATSDTVTGLSSRTTTTSK
jgi:hypothetical protein